MTEKEFYTKIGQRYREVRESKDIKLVEAAKVASLDAGELSRFERQGKKLSAFKIALLLKAVNTSLEELTGEESEKKTKLILRLPDSTPALLPA